MWWREIGEVENECNSHNFSFFAIFLPKIIKIGGNLTKFWQKQFCTVFLETWCSFTMYVMPVDLCAVQQKIKQYSQYRRYYTVPNKNCIPEHQYICNGDAYTLVITIEFLSSFFLFQFPTKISIQFSSMETSLIRLKLLQRDLLYWPL